MGATSGGIRRLAADRDGIAARGTCIPAVRRTRSLGTGRSSSDGAGDEPADQFVYDPDYPVRPRRRLQLLSSPISSRGALDQRDVEMRPTCSSTRAQPLGARPDGVGPVRRRLGGDRRTADTDWTAKLVDVRPSGYAMNLCDGIVRGRWRRRPTTADHADRRTPVHSPGGRGALRDRPDGHRQHLPGGPSNPRRDLVEQLPALRSQPNTGAPLAPISSTGPPDRAPRRASRHTSCCPSSRTSPGGPHASGVAAARSGRPWPLPTSRTYEEFRPGSGGRSRNGSTSPRRRSAAMQIGARVHRP